MCQRVSVLHTHTPVAVHDFSHYWLCLNHCGEGTFSRNQHTLQWAAVLLATAASCYCRCAVRCKHVSEPQSANVWCALCCFIAKARMSQKDKCVVKWGDAAFLLMALQDKRYAIMTTIACSCWQYCVDRPKHAVPCCRRGALILHVRHYELNTKNTLPLSAPLCDVDMGMSACLPAFLMAAGRKSQ
jgi:hypothetical protein